MVYGQFLSEMRRLTVIKRYQNKFKIKVRSVADHQWSTMRIAHVLAKWQMDFTNIEVDMGVLLQKAMLHDSLKLFTGDIQSNPKNKAYLTDALMDVNNITYHTQFKSLVPIEFGDSLIGYTLHAKDNSVAGRLVALANIVDKMLESIEELELCNKRYFKDVLNEQARRLMLFNIDVAQWFLVYSLEYICTDNLEDILDDEIISFIREYKKGNNYNFGDYIRKIPEYIYEIRDLMHTERYQNLFRFHRRSVSQHEWSVSLIAYSLALIEKNQLGREVDMYKLLSTTLLHDTPEFIVGDVLSSTKRVTKEMEKAVEQREIEAFNNEISTMVPLQWMDEFREKMLYPKDDSIEGQILSAADIIDTIFESVEEIKSGNTEYFQSVLLSGINRLMKMDNFSAKHFLVSELDGLGIDINYYLRKEPKERTA